MSIELILIPFNIGGSRLKALKEAYRVWVDQIYNGGNLRAAGFEATIQALISLLPIRLKCLASVSDKYVGVGLCSLPDRAKNRIG